VYTEKLLDFK